MGTKSKRSQRLGASFTARDTLPDQLIGIENVVRGITLPPGRTPSSRYHAESFVVGLLVHGAKPHVV